MITRRHIGQRVKVIASADSLPARYAHLANQIGMLRDLRASCSTLCAVVDFPRVNGQRAMTAKELKPQELLAVEIPLAEAA